MRPLPACRSASNTNDDLRKNRLILLTRVESEGRADTRSPETRPRRALDPTSEIGRDRATVEVAKLRQHPEVTDPRPVRLSFFTSA